MTGAQFNQEGHIRALFTRFRACSPEHQDRYHSECDKCLMIESNIDRCLDATHTRDKGGVCLTCALIDGRIAVMPPKEEAGVLRLINKFKGKGKLL